MASNEQEGASPSPRGGAQVFGRGSSAAALPGSQEKEGHAVKTRKQGVRKKKFDKNSPSSVTFKLVSASFADPAAQQASAPKMALQRVIPPNALKKVSSLAVSRSAAISRSEAS